MRRLVAQDHLVFAEGGVLVGIFGDGIMLTDGADWERRKADAVLFAASDALVDAVKGLIGLCQLVRNRDDIPAEARQALTHSHRIIAGYEALSAAGIEGFQPSDFDAHKAA